jgi:molybdenum cofactor biosynthesis protein B
MASRRQANRRTRTLVGAAGGSAESRSDADIGSCGCAPVCSPRDAQNGRHASARPRLSLAIALLTVSDTRTLADDASGDALQQRLQAAGHRLVERAIVPDDRFRIRAVISQWIADPAVQVVISSGGTGLTGRDGTPEAVAPLLDKTIEGFGELFRVLSFETIGTSSLQSRALAGVANGTVIFVLPGSLDAVETAWDRLIAAQLDAGTRPCNLVQVLPRLREAPDQPVGPG